MAVQKDLRFLYQARENTTGLTDVVASIWVNGVAKAVGGSKITATPNANGSKTLEVALGVYEVIIKAADLTAWGIAAGSYSALEAVVNSASKPAETIFREELTVANEDDIDVKLGSPAGASVSADIAAIKAETALIKSDTTQIIGDLETGTYSLQNILQAVQAVQNNAGFAVPVPAELPIPATGSNTRRIPVSVYNTANALIDPDSNTITVGLVNQAGTSRVSYLSSTTMTRDSLGQYHVDLSIPSTALEEELLFTFSYAVGGVATARRAVTNTMVDISTSGYALQSTLLATQTTVDAIDTIVSSATFGNAAIKTELDTVAADAVTIKADVIALQSDVTNNVEGTGFSAANDSLHEISVFMRANLFVGGRCF